MLNLTAQHRILLAVEPCDFRKGIDSLAALCKSSFDEDPFTGTVFIGNVNQQLLDDQDFHYSK